MKSANLKKSIGGGYRFALSAVLTGAALHLGATDAIYRNDFTTRVSANPIPAYDVWQEAQPYPTVNDQLCFVTSVNTGFPQNSARYAELASYFVGALNQGRSFCITDRPGYDGWFTPFINRYYKLRPCLKFDDGNLAFCFAYPTTTKRTGVAIQSLHNTFTTGQLRIQVDMRAPERWGDASTYMRVFPVYDKYMDILAWNGAFCNGTFDSYKNSTLTGDGVPAPTTPGKFGFRSSGSSASLLRTFPQYYDKRNCNAGTTQLGNNDTAGGATTNYWFRFIVTYDLDANTFSGENYRFLKDKGHPTFDTEPSDAKPYKSFSNVQSMTALSDETGGISGIAIDAYGNFTGENGNESYNSTVLTNKVFVDNLRLSWKAPDADAFEVFYENDFTTRRYKTICAPSRATTAAYAPQTAVVDETSDFTGYTSGALNRTRLVPDLVGSTSAVQPVGLDGWRALPYSNDNKGHPGVIAYGGTTNDKGGKGGNMLTFGYSGTYSLVGQTLGASYASGKVRISADVRLPAIANGNASPEYKSGIQRAFVGLGSTALYTSPRAALAGNLAAGGGYLRVRTATGDTAVTNFVPFCLGKTTSASLAFASAETYTEPDAAAWYRYDLTADLDAKTYDVTVTPLGTASVLPSFEPTETPVYAQTGLPFAAEVTDIGTFCLWGYGYGNAITDAYINSRVCFDNIRVWHDDDLVYANDFTTSTRTLTGVTRAAGYAAAPQYNRPTGQDGWVRRDYAGAAGFYTSATVRDDGGNQYLSLGRTAASGDKLHLTHTLGTAVTRPFRFSADVRPPLAWTKAGALLKFALGDAQMAQTEAAESLYQAHCAVSVGFNGTTDATKIGTSSAYSPYYFAGGTAFAQTPSGTAGLGGDASIVPGHWYRFAAEVDPGAATYAVNLYDMGTAHPAADAANGTLVGTAQNLAFEHDVADGISVFSIYADGLGGELGSLGLDDGHVLIDNILFRPTSGTVITLR